MTEIIDKLLGISESFHAPARLMGILLDGKAKRERLFLDFISAFEYKMGHDWFHEYFQDEHADRRKKRQDFTPASIGNALSEILSGSGVVYEPAAGTGGVVINHWQRTRAKCHPFDFRPSDCLYVCEELSERAFPFLVFNMAIRGMNCVAVHCNALTRESWGAFFIQNDNNSLTAFSSINTFPYTARTEKLLNVSFEEEKYLRILESPERAAVRR